MAETQRRLLVGSLNIVFGILKKINSEGLTRQVSSYFSCAVYKMFRLLYSAGARTPRGFFPGPAAYSGQADAHMTLSEAKSRYLAGGRQPGKRPGLQQEQLSPAITPARLQSAASQYALALLSWCAA